MQSQDKAHRSAAHPAVAGDLRLADILLALGERKRSVLAVIIAVFVVMAVVVVIEQPVYRAYVSVAPSEPLVDTRANMLAAGLLGFGYGGPASAEVFPPQTSMIEAFALLGSRSMSRRFIQAEELMPVLFAEQWDAESGGWMDPDPASQPSIDDALELFERDIRFISRNNATGFMRINIEWTDPLLAARWANGLVAMTDEAIRERDIKEAEQSIRYLQEQIGQVPLESVRQLMYSLIESYTKTIMVARVKDSYAFTIIDPAVAPRIDEPVNMPVSFKLSLALLLALGCGLLYGVAAQAWMRYHGRPLPRSQSAGEPDDAV